MFKSRGIHGNGLVRTTLEVLVILQLQVVYENSALVASSKDGDYSG
jgi:hypothetical protein